MECLLSEREVQLVWLLGLFRRRGLLTEDGRAVDVAFPGFPAGEGGPDFRAARLAIGGEPREGDVEVHLAPSGWRAHGHGRDAAYSGVILHVALRRDPFDQGSRPIQGFSGAIPELILEPYLELPALELAARLKVPAPLAAPPSLEALGEERVAARVRAMERLARLLEPDGALYRELMIGLGYRHNKPGFAELARLVPWRRVRGRDAPEAAELYGEVARGIRWRRPGRPANHPRRRLDGWARFVGSLGRAGLIETLGRDPERRLDPDGTGLIGLSRARDLVLSSVLPALLAFGPAEARAQARRRLGAEDPAPANRREREAAAALGIALPRTSMGRLGLLEWRARQ